MGQPFEHKAAQIDPRPRRGLDGDLQDAAFNRRRLVVSVHVIAPDQIDHDVGAVVCGGLFGRGDEILDLVVNGDVGTEFRAGRAFLRRAGSSDDTGAERFCKLNGGGADPEEPPWMSTVSPAVSRPRSNRLYQTVKNVSGMAAASISVKAGRHGKAWLSCAMQYSA